MEPGAIQLDDGLPFMDRRTTVQRYLEHWLKVVAPLKGLSAPTLDDYEWAIEHITGSLGATKFVRLTPDDVQHLLTEKLDAGLSWSSVMRIRAVLVAALTHGERFGHVSRNVARLVTLPKHERAEGRSMTPDQVDVLLKNSNKSRLGAAFVTQVLVGLRPVEVLGLWWEDLDLDSAVPTLTVSRALQFRSGNSEFGAPKTARSRRTVALPLRAAASLKAHRKAQAKERLEAREWADSRIVFASTTGTPIDFHNFRRSFRLFTEQCGLGTWTPNELRHTCVSLLAAADVPLDRIADHVGHSSTRMTAGVYRHIVTPSVGADPDAMDRLLS